jgi:hypothetical protein
MFIGVVCAKPNMGKSWLSISFCEALDRTVKDVPRFTIDRVCFSAAAFSRMLAQDLPVGTCIVFDDAGLNLFSRESMTKEIILIAKQLQQIRYKNYIIFLNLPRFKFLDKIARDMADAYIEPTGIDDKKKMTKFKFHEIVFNPKGGDEPIFKRPVVIKEQRFVGVKGEKYSVKVPVTTSTMWMPAPPVVLAAGYEIKKREYLNDWNEKTAGKLEAIEAPVSKHVKRFEEVCDLVRKNYSSFLGRSGAGLSWALIANACGCGQTLAQRVIAQINCESCVGLPRKDGVRVGGGLSV